MSRRRDRETLIPQAISLREEGLSAKEISIRLGVPKGTIGHWVANVSVSENHRNKLQEIRLSASRQGCSKGSAENKRRSDQRHREAYEHGFNLVLADPTFAVVCALYWGEGQKRGATHFVLSNSDASMLRFACTWLSEHGFPCQISIAHHRDGTSEDVIRQYWREQIPSASFGNRVIHWKPVTSNKSGRRMTMGCAQLIVYNTSLWFMVIGGIARLSGKSSTLSEAAGSSPSSEMA